MKIKYLAYFLVYSIILLSIVGCSYEESSQRLNNYTQNNLSQSINFYNVNVLKIPFDDYNEILPNLSYHEAAYIGMNFVNSFFPISLDEIYITMIYNYNPLLYDFPVWLGYISPTPTITAFNTPLEGEIQFAINDNNGHWVHAGLISPYIYLPNMETISLIDFVHLSLDEQFNIFPSGTIDEQNQLEKHAIEAAQLFFYKQNKSTDLIKVESHGAYYLDRPIISFFSNIINNEDYCLLISLGRRPQRIIGIEICR